MRASRVLALLAAWVCVSLPPASARDNAVAPQWAVDAADSGPDAPPAGRSLFDFVFAEEGRFELPFPFDALIRKMEQRARCSGCAKAVLIPLGRSLQRTAAAPDFFKSPRVVVTIDSAALTSPLLLKDRIYLGYQEKSEVIEVISYNEAAARFEFQIVTDYRRGGTPQITYARRALCAACHQNLAPIFSRQLWDETNANPRVAEKLARERAAFYGIRVQRGVDLPNAIDDATDRANQIAVVQRLWRDGCGPDAAGARCRAALFTAALQYRLTDGRAFDQRGDSWQKDLAPIFTQQWRARWPGGLAIPNPDLPNRDPLLESPAPLAGVALTHVAAAFEPLAPRPPLEVWTFDQPNLMPRIVAALGEMIAPADVRALDHALTSRQRAATQTFGVDCEVTLSSRRARFKCASAASSSTTVKFEGRFELTTGKLSGELASLTVGGQPPLQHLGIHGGAYEPGSGRARLSFSDDGRRMRLADGRAIDRIELNWRPGDGRVQGAVRVVSARARVEVVDDFAEIAQAVDTLAADASGRGVFGAPAFSRARVLSALFAHLGSPYRVACCEDTQRLPAAQIEPAAPRKPTAGPAQLAALYPVCGSCHATESRFPPNFLAGTDAQVAANLQHCAPRIYARLAMNRLAPAARDKTPMPPSFPTVAGGSARAVEGLAELEGAIEPLLVAEYGAKPRLEQMLANGYEALRACLPEQELTSRGAR